MRTALLLTFLFAALPVATPVGAQQEAPARDGFFISLSTGWGTVGYSCDGCESLDRVWGSAGDLRLGVAVSPNLLLSADVVGWINWWDGSGIDYLRSSILASLTFYPSPSPSGFWLSAAGGYGIYSEKLDQDKLSINGVEALARVGYDFRVARNFSVSPYGEFGISFGGSLKVNDVDTGVSANTNMFNLGIMVTFH